MKISIIHPSRSRPDKSVNTIDAWILSAGSDIEVIVSLDEDDPLLGVYTTAYTKLVVEKNRSAIDAINNAAKLANGDIIVVVSDDTDCPYHWDRLIIEALEGRSGVLKTFDGVQKWIVTMPIMTRDYYESKGYIYHPDYRHMFCDTHLTHVADLEKKLIFRNDLVFPHNHYSTGKSKKDAVNIKNDSTWAQGEAAYLRHCRNKFGMNVDIFNLSKEAHQAGHVAWLKKKLR